MSVSSQCLSRRGRVAPLSVRLALFASLLPLAARAQVIPDWSSGSPPVTVVGAGQTLNLTTANTKSVGAATLTNSGTINFLGGSLNTSAGGAVINTATGSFIDNSTSSLTFSSGDFTNQGAYRKLGAGTTTLSGNFTHSGTVQVEAGTLAVSGTSNSTGSFTVASSANLTFSGSASLKDGAGVSGTGTASLASGTLTVVSGTSSFSNFTLGGGSLAGAGTAAFGALATNSGGIAVTAFSISGNATWTGGNWNASAAATATIASTATLNLTGVGVKDFNFRTVTNNGTVNWQGGQFRTGNGGGFVNAAGATFNDSASNSINAAYGGTGSFANAGTFNKLIAGNTSISVPFTNSGTVSVATGILELTGGGHSSGNIVLGNTTSVLRVSTPVFEFRGGSVLNGPGSVEVAGPAQLLDTVTGSARLNVVSGGSLTVTGNTTLGGGGTFSGGVLAGPGTLTLGGPINLSGTSLTGNGTVVANAGVSITNSFSINSSRTLTLGGNSTWSAGYIYAGGNSIFNLPANTTLSTGFDGTLNGTYYDSTPGRTQLNLAGTFIKTAGAANDSTHISAAFNNSGLISVQAGTLELAGGGTHAGTANVASGATLLLSGGNHTFSSGAQVTGSGNLRVSAGNATFSGATTGSANIVLAGGTTAFNGTTATSGGGTFSGGTLAGTGSVTFAAPLTLNGTSLTGAGTVVANSGVAITNSFSINSSRTLTLGGNSTWSAGTIYAGGNSLFNLPANTTLTTSFDGTLNGTYYDGPGARSQFNNAGTFTKTAGAANDSTYVSAAFNNSGLLAVQAGTVDLAGGGTQTGRTEIAAGAFVNVSANHTLAGNATVTGGGTLKLTGGTLSVTGAPAIAQLAQSGGTLSGNGTLAIGNLTLIGGNFVPDLVTLTGNGTWSAGTMNGVGTTAVAPGASLALGSGSAHDLNSRAFVNRGTVTWSHEYLRGGTGAVFTNHGTFVDTQVSGWSIYNPFGGTFSFVNHGTYRRAPGSNTVSYIDVPFANHGSVEVASGSLQFRAGGSLASTGTISAASGAGVTFTNGFTVANGASLTGAGTFGLTGGTLDITGTFNVPTFNQSGGVLEGINTLNGIVNWTGGTWNAAEAGRSTTIAAGATLNLADGGAKDFNRRAIVNQGTVNWTHEFVRGGTGSVFTNAGTFVDTQTAGWSINNPFGGTFSFVNQGTYRRNPGNASISYIDVPFTNQGTVEVLTGALQFRAGGTLAATGTVSTAAGASVTFTEGFNVANGSSLTGPGIYQLTGGTLHVDGTLAVSTFNQTGGVLEGTHAIGGIYHWTAGNWNTATANRTTTVLAGSTLNLGNGGAKDFNRRAIVNQGTVNWTHEFVRGGTGSVFTNAGTFVDTQTGGWSINNPFGGTFSFVNQGTYRRAAADNSITYIDVPFANQGRVEVVSGNLQFRAGGTLAAEASISAAAGTAVTFTEGFTVASGASLAGAGAFHLTGGTFAVTGNVAVGAFHQTGGILAGTHTLAGTFHWTGGNWNADTDGLRTTVAAGATLNLASGNSKDFNRRTVVNQGTAVWTSGYLRGGNGSVFTNAGTFQDRNASGYSFYAPYGGSFVFDNTGTYVREAADTTYFDIPFNNSGSLEVRSGSVQLREGGTMSGTSRVSVAANASLLFTSSYTILDGAEFAGAGNVVQTGGSLAIDGTLKAAVFNWQGGNWNTETAATTTIGAGSTLNLISGANKDLAGRTVVNRGTVNWQLGYIGSGKGGAFTNAVGGTFNDANASSYSVRNNFGGTFVFTNEGTYVRNTGGTTFFDTTFVNLGTVELQAGTLQLREGGSMGATSVVNTAAGATLFIAGDYSLLTGARFTGPGSVVHSAGNLTIDGVLKATAFTWSGGTWNSATGGVTTVDPATVLALVSGNNKDLRGRTLRNEGTLNWDLGYIRGGDGSLLLNAAGGTFNDRNASGYSVHNAFGGAFRFRNEGTYVRDVGGVTYFDVPFENAGSVQVRQGVLQIRQGGTLAPAGVIDVSPGATLAITNGFTVQNGGQFTGSGNILFSGGTLVADVLRASAFTWEGGNLNSATAATTTVAKGSTLRLTTGNHKDFSGRALVVEGTMIWNSGYIRGGDGSTLTIASGGTFNDQNVSGYSIHNAFGGSFGITNHGTYLRSTTGHTRIEVPFTNHGTLSIQAGSVQFTDTFTNHGGLQFANGASAFFPGPVTFNQPLGGTGTIHGSVTAASSVSPGNSPGTLTITGNLTLLSTSSLLLEIGGTVQGTGYDFLNVQGNAAVAGTLSLTLLGAVGTTILPTDTFTVVRAAGTGGLTGAFANIANGGRLLTSDGGGIFTVNYGAGSAFAANSVVLSNFQAIPEPSTYALLALGALALLLTRRRK